MSKYASFSDRALVTTLRTATQFGWTETVQDIRVEQDRRAATSGNSEPLTEDEISPYKLETLIEQHSWDDEVVNGARRCRTCRTVAPCPTYALCMALSAAVSHLAHTGNPVDRAASIRDVTAHVDPGVQL